MRIPPPRRAEKRPRARALAAPACALAACAALAFSACSRAEPSISYWTMRVVYYAEGDAVIPRLSFFVLAADGDGPEDIAELRLYNDFEGLLWALKPEQWSMMEDGDNTWIGSHTLSMAGSEAFPSGQWRAVIIDKSGEQSEKTFGFDVPKESKHPFPKLAVANGNWELESEYPEGFMLCYDAAGEHLRTARVSGKSGSINSLGVPPETAGVAYWGEDAESACAALTLTLPSR